MPGESCSIYHSKSYNESAFGHKNSRVLKSEAKCQQASKKEGKCCCLRSKRNPITKIAAIQEESEDLSEHEREIISTSNCLKMPSCWQAKEQEVEVYQTKTTIYKSVPNNKMDVQPKILKQPNSLPPAAETTTTLDCRQNSDIPTISGSLLKSSLQNEVTLRQYGSLLDTQNNNDNALTQLEVVNRARPRKRSRLESLKRLLNPFRGKCHKTEPKVQAIVYKTYFVNWIKPSNTPSRVYSTNSLRSSSVLRRCRSALF